MKRMLFTLMAVTALTASSGCCCLESWWCRPWGCRGPCGCTDCGCGCGDGGCYDTGCGYGGCGSGSCGAGGGCGCGGPYAQQAPTVPARKAMLSRTPARRAMASKALLNRAVAHRVAARRVTRRACAAPGCGQRGCKHQRRNPYQQYGPSQYAEEVGPPTGTVTYPYYTNRGPRDFLARNPGSIGP